MHSVPFVFASIAASVTLSVALTALVAVGARVVLRRLTAPRLVPPAPY